jgi:hypothetical protein
VLYAYTLGKAISKNKCEIVGKSIDTLIDKALELTYVLCFVVLYYPETLIYKGLDHE